MRQWSKCLTPQFWNLWFPQNEELPEKGALKSATKSRDKIAHRDARHRTPPVKISGMKVEHKFHVSAKSEAKCFIGLDFLEDHQCDPLTSKKKLRLNDDTCVPLYHKVYSIETDQVFRVVATDSVLVAASHSMIKPAHIPEWKRSPIDLANVFEPHERFKVLTMFCSTLPRKWSRWWWPIVVVKRLWYIERQLCDNPNY